MIETTFSIRVPNNLLQYGYTQEKIQRRVLEWMVFSLYQEDKISSGKAAQLLGINRLEFIELLQEKGFAYIDYPEEEVAQEIAAVKSLRTNKKA
jgi:predicted HTH domain antitoxin